MVGVRRGDPRRLTSAQGIHVSGAEAEGGCAGAVGFADLMTFWSRRPRGVPEADLPLRDAHEALEGRFNAFGNCDRDFTAIGFTPERGNRLVYVFAGGRVQRRDTAALPVGNQGIIGADQFQHPNIDSRGAVMVAIGDVDQDGVPLVMSVATFDGTEDRKPGPHEEPFVERRH